MTIHRFGGALLVSALVAWALVSGPGLKPLSGQPPTVATASQPKASGGFVLQDPNCGCEGVKKDRPGGPFPTRCRDTNTKQTGTYRPKNDERTDYPGPTDVGRPHVYPAGFPFGKFPQTSAGAVPFPGWPAVNPGKGNNVSKWDSTKREAYKNKYEGVAKGAKPPGDTKPPGRVTQPYCCGPTVGKTGWEYWQIHHILERKHNGTDVDANMVPMYSRSKGKGGPNLHNDFTQWWQNIRVDSEFKVGPKGGDPAVWNHVSKCAVKPWP